jgi:hypothetical protein
MAKDTQDLNRKITILEPDAETESDLSFSDKLDDIKNDIQDNLKKDPEKNPENDIKAPAAQNYEDTLSDVENTYGGKTNCNMSDIEQLAKEMLKTLPKLNRDALRKEMAEMHVTIHRDPTTFNINEGLALVQGYKDRLAGILALAQKEYNLRDKVFDMLIDANSVVSKASSADKRKGEAIMKYPVAFLHLEASETFMEEVELFANNMKSIGEAISRQVSVLSNQISLGEYISRRHNNNFTNSPAEEIDYKSGTKKLEWDNVK